MNRLNFFKSLIIVILAAGMTACTGLEKKQSVPEQEQDLFQVQKLADEAYQKDDYPEAEKQYTILVKKNPADPLVWFRLANVYARTNRPDAAVAAYREALVRDPELSKAWYNMGLIQLKEAVHSFTQLQVYTKEDQPLYEQSRKIVDGLVDILDQGNDSGN